MTAYSYVALEADGRQSKGLTEADSERHARRLLRAGVPTELYVAPGAFHGFEAMVPEATVSRRFIAFTEEALKRAFAEDKA